MPHLHKRKQFFFYFAEWIILMKNILKQRYFHTVSAGSLKAINSKKIPKKGFVFLKFSVAEITFEEFYENHQAQD